VKIGALGSAGGSSFAAFHDILAEAFPGKHTFVAVTDRSCGFEDVCRERDIPFQRVESRDRETMSREAADFLASAGAPDIVVLYFLRLVGPSVYDRFPTFNIHPSLLPAFPGFHATTRTLEAGVRFFGATVHQVDATVDSGTIVAQVAMPLDPATTPELMETLSYLQKVYCALLLVDLVERRSLTFADGRARVTGDVEIADRSNPALSGPLLEGFRALQRREGVAVIP
jgi:phosphoribosylglycinamide formyltransferase 1